MRHAIGLLLVLLLAAASPAGAQPAVDARVDSLFARWDRLDSPGCALGVVRNGVLAYERGYGSANLDYGLPNGPDMVYYVGSISKQFTAASIALLAQEGRIRLDDDVRSIIPELPDYGRRMTIRHLIHHTSGIRDIYTLMSLAAIRMEDVFTDEDALALIARQKELNFLPGEEHLYSNSGYWLLGQIVERVTGQSLREYAREKIFQPLGMRDTHFHDEPWHPLTNRVVSYTRGGPLDAIRIAYLANFDKIGAGGLYTTIGDLAKWDANFHTPRVGGDAFLDTMHGRGVLASGDTLRYAFGLTIGDYRGLRTVRHAGSLMGFRAEMVRFPDERFTVIVTCNMGNINATDLANGVADIYLGERMEPAIERTRNEPPMPGLDRDAAAAARGRPVITDLAAFAGEYRSEELDVTYRIDVDGETLTVRRRTRPAETLQPLGADAFAVDNQQFRFVRDGRDVPNGFTVQAGRVRNVRFDRVDRMR